MRPQSEGSFGQKLDLFRSKLKQILNRKHPLFKLADSIDWAGFDQEFGAMFCEDFGRPALSTRLMVGLHYLRAAYDESDESAVERFLENPYWQYFCGFEYFQHEFPCDPSSMVRWRKRIGEKGFEKLLSETISVAERKGLFTSKEIQKVNVDTTVQEKAIAFPTDSRLYHKMRRRLVKAARHRGVALRQTFERMSKRSLLKQSRYAHAKQMRRARAEVRKLRIYLGRVMRDIRRKVEKPDEEILYLLALAERLFQQKREDSNKLYSIHAPEVECISKGKAHKRYEFGCKVSVATTSKNNWIVGIQALHGNPYDGHTMPEALKQIERVTGVKPEFAFCDRGYRGAEKCVTETQIIFKKYKHFSQSMFRWLKRRAAIEPIIGHLKHTNGMDRNHLLGQIGDKHNALMAGSGRNLRKLLRAFFLFQKFWRLLIQNMK
ncbi:IS5 family transposase, partial [bacterium]|nr:IS5 family transposase [bacterium]